MSILVNLIIPYFVKKYSFSLLQRTTVSKWTTLLTQKEPKGSLMRKSIVVCRYMTINMNDSHITSLAQLKEFAKFSHLAVFTKTNTKETYEWISEALTRLDTSEKLRKGEAL